MSKSMKINKLFFIILVAALFNGCASGETKSQSKAKVEAEAEEQVIEPTISKIDETELAKPEPPKKVVASAEEPLNQAIKKQNESEINKAANDLLVVIPTNLKALNALGLLNYKKGKYKAAEYFFNKALKAHPEESGLYNNLALCKLAQADQREAVKLFKAGLAQKPGDIVLSTNLGSIYSSQKDFPNAELALEPVYKSGSKDVKALTNYATALAANKKISEATQIYQKLLAENASSREIMLNYSVHLVENAKDYKQGLDLINRLKFVGVPDEARNIIKDLENKAKAGLK